MIVHKIQKRNLHAEKAKIVAPIKMKDNLHSSTFLHKLFRGGIKNLEAQ